MDLLEQALISGTEMTTVAIAVTQAPPIFPLPSILHPAQCRRVPHCKAMRIIAMLGAREAGCTSW